jgi:hypothetical protein
MIKLLITGVIIYFIYRFFIAPPAIDRTGREEPPANRRTEPQDDEEGEYVDFEEVD